MRSDFTNPKYEAKIEARRGNIAVLTDPSRPNTLVVDRKLTCDWLELAGERCPSFQLLLDAALLTRPAQFVGVDDDADVVQRNMEHFKDRSEASWVCAADALDLLVDADAYPELGVLIFDGFDSPKQKNKRFDGTIRRLAKIAKARAKRMGSFFLAFTAVARGTTKTDLDRMLQIMSTEFETEVRLQDLHRYVSKRPPVYLARVPFGF